MSNDLPEKSKSSPAAGNHERCDPAVLEILVCPHTKTRLVYDEARQELVSRAAGVAYPIRKGVPMMTLDAARRLDSEGETA